MAGAMRRMGIYLGLVEDDDPRGYGRYDSRQSEHLDHDRRYGRYADDHYDGHYDTDYAGGYVDDDHDVDDVPAVREPEPVSARRVTPRPIGLAPAGASGGAAGARVSALGGSVPEPKPAQPYRITTLHPRTYNEARTIGERFREGSPVIMNLTELDHSDARRLVDFAAGLIFGLRGSIEPVTAKVFLLSPQNVDVTAEDKARIREGGFFNQS
jgi:cell division inhibitor SepF